MTATAPSTYRGENLYDCGLEMMDDCTHLLDQPEALREQMQKKGYLFFKGFHARDEIMAGRKVVASKLLADGILSRDADPMLLEIADGKYTAGLAGGVLKDLFPDGWETLHDTLYAGKRMALFETLFGESPRHYDFTWMRLVNPGPATTIHADSVYMGRGTHEVYTCWTPWGDNPLEMGGLILLEGSHKRNDLLQGYWNSDVDAFCANTPDKRDGWAKNHGGFIRGTAREIRDLLGGHFVTSDYQAGDLVVFPIHTIHGGTDNHTTRVRLSSDTRYQRKSAAIDERWIGENPPGHHGPNAKRGMIC
jgi:hypothetical protein